MSAHIPQRRGRFPHRFFMLCAAVLIAGFMFASSGPTRTAAASGCSQGAILNMVAHEDDDLLFLSPDLLHSIQAGLCVRTIFFTAGDDGLGSDYWLGREAGSRAAYAQMNGVANTWTQTDAGISGHPMPLFTLSGRPNISLVFMRLPDGNLDGSGFSSTGHESLQKLWQGSISTIHVIDGSSSYSKTSLTTTLTALMTAYQPTQIRTQDYLGAYGDGDHSDHHTAGYFTQAAQQQYTTTHTFTGYEDYNTVNLPPNVTGADLDAKDNAFFTYAQFDPAIPCDTLEGCDPGTYGGWLQRQYTVGSGNHAPVANAGPNQTVNVGANVQLDGSASSDPDGNPLTYQWTQTGGPAVTLSSSAAVKPTFTAPASATTLTFQLIVNDGLVDSTPATVTITVKNAGNNPPVANAGTNQVVGFSAAVQLDGSASSDPDGNPLTYQWTQTGGPAVTLSSTTAVKPTFTAPASATTMTFQLVVNDGLVNSTPATVSVSVEQNVAGSATATASSQNTSTSQTADKAIDGVIDGWPGDYTREWATNGGGAGSWLKLTWSSAQTVNAVVLYDRPNLNDQITGGSIQFSDGTSIPISALNNDGTAVSFTFANKTITSLQLNITAVSGTTQNVGLAEIQVYAVDTGGGSQPPVANAGTNQTVNVGANVQLDGSASSDPNGNPLTYQWTQTGGPAVTLSSTTAVKPTFTAPASPTTLTFQLVVNNGQMSSAPSTVTITVNAATNHAPIANAGPNQTVGVSWTVQLDGSASSDPDGNPITYQWTQTGGPAVTLSSTTAVKPTFTAPASPASLVFRLVVSDGQLNSAPVAVAISVERNMAGSATATASSQNTSTGQTANKAIDGVIDGYPGDYTKEWATRGGGAGSWLKLTWSSARTVNMIVLYDRPNLNDQITGGSIQFSDGTSIPISTLNNNGSATVFTFPNKTITSLQLNVTAVSGTTLNVGLAEIQVFGS